MSTEAFDLDAYFNRIGYTGERAATLDVLRGIHARHAESIPFENLNPLLGWPVRLDIESLQQKLVHEGRGGYCFEQNGLFSHALKAIGFKVIGLAARVMWEAREDVVPSRSHMLVRVDLDGQTYIADTGFGGLTLTGPLRLEADIEQATPHEPFRLIRRGGEFVQQSKIGGIWKALYRFTLEEQLPPDYEVTNWYLSNHPNSRFVTGLIAARPDAGRRYALHNNEFSIHHLDGRTERRTLGNAAELREVLEGPLRVRLPTASELDTAFERLTSPL
jgi:N-hydroxyarylamine O-acetyltransferase